MALPFPIAPSQTDAKSPVDDNLMDSIRENLDYLDAIATQGGAPVYVWNVNGRLARLPGKIAKRIDTQFLHVQQVFTKCRVAQRESGSSGTTEVDIRYHSTPKTPIIAIDHQFQANTQSISYVGLTGTVQSVARTTAQIATQSITFPKADRNIQSIVNVGTNKWRYNVDTLLDADFIVGDTFTITGCSNAANNGAFVITEVNPSGFPGFVVTNASGVAQTTAAGTARLQLLSYNFTNPVNTQGFAAGELFLAASHTSAFNNFSAGAMIYKVNEGGNNIWCKQPTGVAQGSAAGTVDCYRWTYSFLTDPGSSFVVGERAYFTNMTSGGNNLSQPIKLKNINSLFNLVVYNPSGVAQGSAIGQATTQRMKYVFGSNPATNVSIGDTLIMAGHTKSYNNGTFVVVEVNNNTSDNIVVYNVDATDGLGAQASAAGTVTHIKKLVKFSSDQSLIYSTESFIELKDCLSSTYNMLENILPFRVKQVNRGGGANYNIVIESLTGPSQTNPAGFVAIEARSIFTVTPKVTTDLVGLSPNGLLKTEVTTITSSPIPAQTYLGLYILSIQNGDPKDLSVMLT